MLLTHHGVYVRNVKTSKFESLLVKVARGFSAHSTDPDVKTEPKRGGEGRKTSLPTRAEFDFLPSTENVLTLDDRFFSF